MNRRGTTLVDSSAAAGCGRDEPAQSDGPCHPLPVIGGFRRCLRTACIRPVRQRRSRASFGGSFVCVAPTRSSLVPGHSPTVPVHGVSCLSCFLSATNKKTCVSQRDDRLSRYHSSWFGRHPSCRRQTRLIRMIRSIADHPHPITGVSVAAYARLYPAGSAAPLPGELQASIGCVAPSRNSLVSRIGLTVPVPSV